MQKPKEITISKFKTTRAKASLNIPLFEELREIKTGKYRSQIENCRVAVKNGDIALYSALKSKLPCVTFCGRFENGHKAEDLQHYNQLMVIDIDHLESEQIETLAQKIKKDPHLLAFWLSPSGLGFKGLVATDNGVDEHRKTFDSLRVYFLDSYDVELDKSGSDVSRLCFSSWDPDIHYNADAIAFNEILDFQQAPIINDKPIKQALLSKSAHATEGLNASQDRMMMKRLIKYLEKSHRSITANYENWVKVALAVSYTFSYDVGEKYFIQLCRIDGVRHDEQKSQALLKYCYNRRKTESLKTMSLGTIIYLAKQEGFISTGLIKNK